MRLIDAEKLKEKTFSYNFKNLIDDAPTVDAEPIRHGHWEYNPKDAFEVMFKLPKCSVCGHESSDALKYCSNCGALMDEVGEDE